MKVLSNPLSLVCILLVTLATACATPMPSEQRASGPGPSQVTGPDVHGAGPSVLGEMQESNLNTLQNLWIQRTADPPTDTTDPNTDPAFILGPGDVLKISVPKIPQLKDQTVRVSEKATIALPLLGVIDVRHMTQQDLLNDLSRRVRRYMYHPQVSVFLVHSENRDVAVLGAVKTPGRYMIAGRSDSIMTMIGRSGGTTVDAASQIILLPAPSKGQPASNGSSNAANQRVGTADPSSSTASGVSPVALHDVPGADALMERSDVEQVVISPSNAEDRRYLELPVRPGDVIIVPTAGQVTVQGWVDKSGAYPIKPGMTVLGSIAAAGGALYSSDVTLLRTQGDGRKLAIPLDLTKLKNGEEPDVLVQSGDVVVVERSAAGALPYSLYFLAQRISIGSFAGIP
jgi:polysaccharide biosynthesis/export protein